MVAVTGQLIFPRLTDTVAAELRGGLLGRSPDAAAREFALSHPAAYYAAVGGVRVTADRLADVREETLESLGPLISRAFAGDLNKQTRSEMDLPLGRVLHRTMGIVPSDAASDGVWSFMSLVLLPEVTVARFPEGHIDRWLGRPRNALRRAWWREHVLGEVLHATGEARPLGEDELVGLFERTSIAEEPRVARELGRRILAFDGPGRSDYARRLSKRVLAEMAVVELAVLNDDEIVELVARVEQKAMTIPEAAEPAERSARAEDIDEMEQTRRPILPFEEQRAALKRLLGRG